MKRDMELIRQVILNAECGPPFPTPEGWTEDAVKYHQMLAIKAGLLDGSHYKYAENATEIPSVVIVNDVTWEGHDFIEAIRDDNNWNKVKRHVLEAGRVLTIETVKWSAKALFGVA